MGKFWQIRIGRQSRTCPQYFQQVEGEVAVNDRSLLYVDCLEMHEGLPVNVKMIACTLDQLAENVRMITKEMFKLSNLIG